MLKIHNATMLSSDVGRGVLTAQFKYSTEKYNSGLDNQIGTTNKLEMDCTNSQVDRSMRGAIHFPSLNLNLISSHLHTSHLSGTAQPLERANK